MAGVTQRLELLHAQNKLDAVLEDIGAAQAAFATEDPVKSAFYGALLEARESMESVRELVDGHVARTPEGTPPSLIVRKLFKRNYATLIDNGYSFPRDFRSEDGWLENHFRPRLGSKDNPIWQQVNDTLDLPYQKNDYARSKVLALGAAVLGPRSLLFGDQVVHEYGAAKGHVLGSLMLKNAPPTEIVDENENENPHASQLFNWLVSFAHVNKAIGIEKKLPKTILDARMVKADTIDPSQHGSAEEEAFDLIDYEFENGVLKDKVIMVEDDFMNLDKSNAALLHDNLAQISYLGHVLAQNPGRIKQTIDTVSEYMHPDGWILINEYAYVDPDNPQEMRILPHWNDQRWLVTTFVFDVARPEKGFMPMFMWEDSHCSRAKICPQIGRIANSLAMLRDS